jgi:hypothetical protein
LTEEFLYRPSLEREKRQQGDDEEKPAVIQSNAPVELYSSLLFPRRFPNEAVSFDKSWSRQYQVEAGPLCKVLQPGSRNKKVEASK